MTLAALLPPSSTPLERATVDALAVCTDPSIIRRYHNPDTCPVELLPLLAWERHVDGADAAATPDQLRELIKHSFELHRLRGTPWAVLTALTAIGYPRARLTEWWETTPQGHPGTFRVTLPWQPALGNAAEWARIKSAVTAYKNVRSWPEWSTVVVAVPVDDLPDDPARWPKTKLIHPRAAAGIGIVQARQQTRRMPLVMKRAGAGVGVVRIRQAARVAQIIQPRAGAGFGIIRLGTLPADSWQSWLMYVPKPRRMPLVMKRAGAGVGVVRIRQAARPAQIIQPRAGGGIGIIRLGTLPADSWQSWSMYVIQPAPPAALVMPHCGVGIGIVQVRQQTRRMPLVMKRAGAGVGVVRIRQAARVAQIIQPRAGAGFGIIRLGTLPPDSWQTWARPVGDVDAFRRGLLHGWTTRQPRTWRDGNFDSHALVALLRSKFGV